MTKHFNEYTGKWEKGPEPIESPEDRKAEEAQSEYQQLTSPRGRRFDAGHAERRETRMIDVTKDTNPKDAIGCKKPPLSTLPMAVLFELGSAMLEGACKYRRHNYRISGVRASIYFDATMRHLAQWWEGEDLDPDSGIHHVTKAMASLLVLRDAMMNDKVLDDRPPVADSQWMRHVQDRVDDVLQRYPNPLPPYTQDPNLDIGL